MTPHPTTPVAKPQTTFGARDPSRDAAIEIGSLVTRILALAPAAGLFVGIKIEPARILPSRASAELKCKAEIDERIDEGFDK